jgi:DNA-binding transcriptional MocR family regulator
LPLWVLRSPAYQALGLGARALLIELLAQFNGRNNGRLMLSHRLAAERLGCHRNSVGGWYRELAAKGFIRQAQGHCLGADGSGRAALWTVTLHPHGGAAPTNDFARWGQPEKQKPRTITGTPRHNDCDGRTPDDAD